LMDYEKILNPEVIGLKPSGIRKFFDIAEKMDDVISLGVGEPDFQTPWQIRKTGIHSLEESHTRYTSNQGLQKLRDTISGYVKRKYNIKYCSDEQIVITVGGSEAIDLAVRAIVSAGDEVIIPQPSYVCYEPITRLAGGIPVIIETKAQDKFKLTPEALLDKITDKTKALILPYPSNPTGAVMEREDLEKIAEVLKNRNIIVISDEIYSELTFGSRHVSIASIEGMYDKTIVINGFSKAFSMTGWRLGYACGPREIIKQMIKIHQYAIMCAPTTSQYAAITAMTECDDVVNDMIEEYDTRRRLIVDGFNKLGLTCHDPRGAFYAFPSIEISGMTSEQFCEELLYKKKVAIVPGTAFGKSGEGFVRASYCYSSEHIQEALKRIGEFLDEINKRG